MSRKLTERQRAAQQKKSALRKVKKKKAAFAKRMQLAKLKKKQTKNLAVV